MIIDSSAVVAVLRREPEAEEFARLIAGATNPRMSTATYVELVNVIDRRLGDEALAIFDRFIEAAEIELVAFTPEQAQWARQARLTFGVGRHKAALNFGDCFAYALAKETGEALLFKGGDFAETDVTPAA